MTGYSHLGDFFSEMYDEYLASLPVTCPKHGSGEHIHPIIGSKTTFTCGKCCKEQGWSEALRLGVDVELPHRDEPMNERKK